MATVPTRRRDQLAKPSTQASALDEEAEQRDSHEVATDAQPADLPVTEDVLQFYRTSRVRRVP